ncbi:MAG: hypothetical protein ACI9IP_002614 [Arcticibacterium sp.]|jgi:hypothetical protein
MHAYHISYAAFSAKEYSGDNDYVRLRRYNPNGKGMDGTSIPEDHFKTGLFKTDVSYHIQIFKYENLIEMRVQNKEDNSDHVAYKWDVSVLPDCDSGRIGLRHMYTRKARYQNFKVWSLE